MSAAILDQGKTSIRDQLKTLFTHLAVTDDNTAFSGAHTGANPNATGTSTHVEAVSNANVDGATYDASITIIGATEFTGKSIWALCLAKGLAIRSATGSGGTHTGGGTVGTDTMTRAVRTLALGVQSGDTLTVGIRVAAQDNS